MVKILYGIQGTGNGHITRFTRIIEALKSHDVSINVIISGCKTDKVLDKSIIGPVRFYIGFTCPLSTRMISGRCLNRLQNTRSAYTAPLTLISGEGTGT